jgi:phosphohistidine phosphatase SixA
MMTRRVFLVTILPATAVAASCGGLTQNRTPAEVFIIRHAEEPDTGAHLSDQGRERAKALVQLFSGRFTKPTALYATATSGSSTRSFETLEPIAAALGLQIDQSCSSLEYNKLASLIMSNQNAGGHVLACWHRESIADLAEALGVRRAPHWPPTQYDHVWWLRYADGRPTFSDEGQRLLSGDK